MDGGGILKVFMNFLIDSRRRATRHKLTSDQARARARGATKTKKLDNVSKASAKAKCDVEAVG